MLLEFRLRFLEVGVFRRVLGVVLCSRMGISVGFIVENSSFEGGFRDLCIW